MTSFISGRPSPCLKDILLQDKKKGSAFPLNQERCLFFFSGRYALAAAIEALGLQPGDKILVPSYNCGTELDPMLHFNVEPVFYKVNKDLFLDIDDLLGKITSRVRGILITHFLGFPQPVDQIRKICIERDLFLIEDCAHALLSSYKGRPLGSYGDVSIFSLLKLLPVPNGGVLLLNNENLHYSKTRGNPSLLGTVFCTAELLKHKTRGYDRGMKETLVSIAENGFCVSAFSLKILVAIFRKLLRTSNLSLLRPDSYLFEERISTWGISPLTKRMICTTDFEKIKKTRQRNFQYLLDHFSKKRREMVVFDKLSPPVCPLFFPVIVETERKRALLYETLRKKGITTHPWWARFHPQVPWDAFPDAIYLKTRLFGLPIHQDLEPRHLDALIREFERACQILGA